MISFWQITQPVQTAFSDFEKAFLSIVKSDNRLLGDAYRYIVQQRGKSLRPILTLLSASCCREVNSKAIQTAVVMETLHTATLLHDDVVDESPSRHNQTALHKLKGNKLAILVGDYLLARAMSMTAELHNSKLFGVVARLGEGLASGEIREMHQGESMWISEDQYLKVIEEKTAVLFAACAEGGAISAAATPKQQTAMTRFGKMLGMCFQIQDDVLDYSDSEQLGKPTMQDIRDSKVTLPLLIAHDRAIPQDKLRLEQLAESLPHESDKDKIFQIEQEIKAFILRYDGFGYAARKMEYYRAQAQETLSIFRPSEAKQSLEKMLLYAINRLY